MASNTPEVQLLTDDGQTTVVKITGYYDAANSANSMVVNTAALAFANTSKTCLVSVSRIQFASDVANGAVQLYWEGSSSNTAIMNFGGGQSGSFDAYITNNAASPTGNIGIRTISLGAGDNYTIVMRLNKEQGYANAFIGYNSYDYRP
jgi:hypothetical protein